jgi:hypothetical protein
MFVELLLIVLALFSLITAQTATYVHATTITAATPFEQLAQGQPQPQ